VDVTVDVDDLWSSRTTVHVYGYVDVYVGIK
jgi:hypothetical protein